MKQFEKWFNKNKVDWPYSPHDIADCKLAWEAALKWTLLTGSWEIVAQEIKEEIYKTDVKT